MRAITIKYFLLAFLFVSTSRCNSVTQQTTKWSNFPLASASDPPPGRAAEPGKDSGIYLGRYKTCKEYGKFFEAQFGFFTRYLVFPVVKSFVGFSSFALVKCHIAHTCHCKNNVYFIEDDLKQPLFRCVETPQANVESKEIYEANDTFPENGVIKFALPQSFCQNQEKTDQNP